MGQLGENWIRRHRLSVGDYYRMGEAGLFAPGARLELVDGEIIDMAPTGSMHAWLVAELTKRLLRAVPSDTIVRPQSPLRLGEHSEPEPDLVIAKPSADGYASRHPKADDALLVIEVSDTTLRYDLEVKVPLYARSGVAAVWLFDIDGRTLRIHEQPAADSYHRKSCIPGTQLHVTDIAGLAGVSVDLSGLL